MKKFSIIVKIFILSILALSPVFAENDAATSATTQRKTVRVGYFIGEGFQEISPLDGHRSGYCYEYLQSLANYTGWKYEYVETTWAGALEKMKTGEIDILAEVSRTKERQEFMYYADLPMGAEDYYFYVLPGRNKKLRSDDISSLNGAKVGINAGSYQLLTFIDWCKENNVHCNIIADEDEDRRIKQFFDGELDAVVDNDFYLEQGWSPLFKTGKSDYYICVTMSRKDILDELNAAQKRLFESSPLYIEKLQTTYFPHEIVVKNLDNYEIGWLENRSKANKKIRLGYTDNYLPYSNHNKKTGALEGAITIFIENLKEHFSIEIETVPFDGINSLYEATRKNEVDACFPVYNMLWQTEELEIMQTDAFLEFPMAYIFRKNDYDGSRNRKTFAVAKTSQTQVAYIRDKQPGAKIVFYTDYDDCINAVAKEEVDGMYINSFILSRYFEAYQEHSNLDLVYEPKDSHLCFGVSIESCPELLTIFNKNITLIDEAVRTSYLVRNTQTEQKYLLFRFFKTHSLTIVLVILILSALIILSFSIQLKRVRLAQKHEREAKEIANQAFEAANKANNAKTDFLSSMSHDIRTPMNAIIGMTAIAAANIDNSEKVEHCLSEITTSSKHLLSLINEILDMNKIESGKLSLRETEFNLEKMLDDFVSIINPLMEEKEHTFVLNVHDITHENIVGDAERLHQCLMNFVGNSIKYTPKGGTIKLSVTEKPDNRPKIACYEFIIEDNGIGMSEDFTKVMFDPFTRADDKRALGQQGTGLGMSITRNIIKMMDGDIKVESELNEGTKITITVFLAFKKPGKDNSETDAKTNIDDLQKYREKDYKDITALLVEDIGINAEIATEILKMTGMNVEHVWNGKEAVEKLSSVEDGYYNLIFMDIQMPIMDGYEATKQIRASDRKYLKEVPIIAMSANAFADDVMKSKAMGMNDHISKPLDFNRLLEILDENFYGGGGEEETLVTQSLTF